MVIVILGVSLPVAAAFSHPDPAAILRGTFIPTIPQSSGLYSALLLLAAMIGAQAGTMSNLSYAYFATEKGWQGAKDLARQRVDLLVSTACRFGMGTLLRDRCRGNAAAAGHQARERRASGAHLQREHGSAGEGDLRGGLVGHLLQQFCQRDDRVLADSARHLPSVCSGTGSPTIHP